LAFDQSGNLFEADFDSGNIYKFTPEGSRSTFGSRLSRPVGLAFDQSDNLFVSDFYAGSIYKFTPGGSLSIFASGLNEPYGLAFATVPEPSTLILFTIGAIGLLFYARRK
jgi:sugar lactone lactonase YvrE